jgi:hypothetical protein
MLEHRSASKCIQNAVVGFQRRTTLAAYTLLLWY